MNILQQNDDDTGSGGDPLLNEAIDLLIFLN